MKAADICACIERRHPLPRWVTIRELPNATAWKAARRVDVFAIGAWPSEGFQTVAYEVKISRSDFLRDVKSPTKQKFARLFASSFYFAAPDGLVKESEVPDWAGLIEFSDSWADDYYRTAGRITVPAPDLPRIHPTWPFVACLVRKLASAPALPTVEVKG